MTIMNEVDWKKDGETGCLMSLVKVGVGTIALVATVIGAYAWLLS